MSDAAVPKQKDMSEPMLGALLQGAPAITGAQQGLPHRLSDNALVKLFRLLRLARRLRDIEPGIADGDHAITGS